MELKPSMYVRTIKGIVKINEVIDNGVITYEDDFGREWAEETGRKVIRYIAKDGWNCGLDEKEILKASHNIIDLIEVGDYVNGCFVDEILNSDECYDDRTHFHLLKFNSYFTNKDIQSIVTKEQFSQMEYKVVE